MPFVEFPYLRSMFKFNYLTDLAGTILALPPCECYAEIGAMTRGVKAFYRSGLKGIVISR